MNSDVYAIEAQVQQAHWWFVGRRRLLTRLLRSLEPQRHWRVLEVGVGTGANLPVLASLGVKQVVASDWSMEALDHTAVAGVTRARADATRLPFALAAFDLVLAADVIEHLDDDRTALREFARVLRPGGHLVLTVPAFPSLWGPQDIVAHHRRRYRRSPLLTLMREAGITISGAFYFNYLLFGGIWAMRKVLMRLGVTVHSENEINTPLMNRILTRVFAVDIDSAPRIKPPFGVSLCVLGRKPAA
jgi:SAM-dependent methyltransferase